MFLNKFFSLSVPHKYDQCQHDLSVPGKFIVLFVFCLELVFLTQDGARDLKKKTLPFSAHLLFLKLFFSWLFLFPSDLLFSLWYLQCLSCSQSNAGLHKRCLYSSPTQLLPSASLSLSATFSNSESLFVLFSVHFTWLVFSYAECIWL